MTEIAFNEGPNGLPTSVQVLLEDGGAFRVSSTGIGFVLEGEPIPSIALAG